MNIIIQGSFPGGKPHQSVLIQAKQFSNPGIRSNFSNINAYQLDSSRLNLNGNGFPLPGKILQKMENLFNTNFKNVRMHTGKGQAESIGALAFAAGNNIYFARGRYEPHTLTGQRLIAHELTHVVQQKKDFVQNPFKTGIAVINDPRMEAEAERMGVKISNQVIQSKIIQKSNEFFKAWDPSGLWGSTKGQQGWPITVTVKWLDNTIINYNNLTDNDTVLTLKNTLIGDNNAPHSPANTANSYRILNRGNILGDNTKLIDHEIYWCVFKFPSPGYELRA